MNKKQANANLFSARPFASVLLTSILLTATTANATVVSSEADAYALGIDLSLDIYIEASSALLISGSLTISIKATPDLFKST